MGLTDTSAPDDDALYQRYLDGDAAAGDALMLRYADTLTAYLNSLLDQLQDAEDLMLESFAVILIDRPRIREGGFRAYLFQVARNKAKRLWRRKFKQNEFSLTEEIIAADDQPEEQAVAGDMHSVLRRCLNHIAPQYREALWLVYGLEFTYDQTAAVLKCGRKRIDNLLMNGKKALRAELAKQGITDAELG